MNTLSAPHRSYAKVIEVSKRVRWEIDRDVIRQRQFDYTRTFLPDGLSLAGELAFLNAADQRLLSQVQGRTYAYIFGLVERFIAAKVMDLSREHQFGDQVALEALVRMTDEEIKHQELFRRLESMIGRGHACGLCADRRCQCGRPGRARRPTWAVLALTLDIELFTQAHYRASILPEADICAAVEGRVPVPLEGGGAARDPGRDRVREARTPG